jgi:hypothetical protein
MVSFYSDSEEIDETDRKKHFMAISQAPTKTKMAT